MTVELIVFYFLAAASVAGALAVVVPPIGRNPLYSAVALLATFTFLAGIFVMLSAHLVAVLQVLVYAGAVLVLFIFVILLLNLQKADLIGARITPWKIVGAVAVVLFVVKIAILLVGNVGGGTSANLAQASMTDFGGIKDVGKDLLIDYLFPFEATSILLLVAVIGSLIVARREKGGVR